MMTAKIDDADLLALEEVLAVSQPSTSLRYHKKSALEEDTITWRMALAVVEAMRLMLPVGREDIAIELRVVKVHSI